jgi:hypothetical protein
MRRKWAALWLTCITVMALPAWSAAQVTRSFLYLEHTGARFELLLPMETVARWMGKTLPADTMLQAADQETWKREIAAASSDWVLLSLPGSKSQSPTAEVWLIDSSSAATAPFPLAEAAAARADAVHVALCWSLSYAAAPTSLRMALNGVFPDLSGLAVETKFGESTERLHLTSGEPSTTWVNDGRMIAPPAAQIIPKAPDVQVRTVNVALVFWIVLGVGLQLWLFIRGRRWPGGLLPFLFAWFIGGAMLYPMDVLSLRFRTMEPTEQGALTTEQAIDVLQSLLANVYLALDGTHGEQADQLLADAMTKDVGSDVRKRLADDLLIPNHAHLRARVSANNLAVELEEFEVNDAGFTAPVTWTVIGIAHHLGHPDQRVNKYEGEVRVEVEDNVWKITDITIRSHRQM